MSNNWFSKKPFSVDWLYKQFIDPILAKDSGIDAEAMTQIAIKALEHASTHRNWRGMSLLLNWCKEDLQYTNDPRLQQTLFGCNFPNPIGLGAGFDKNGVAAAIWNYFGFGFAELGTVTWHLQNGNPKPRLFRLAKEQGAINRMGFNNNGAEIMKATLERQNLEKPGNRPIAIGLNFGKSKITPLEKAEEDYASSLKLLGPFADYVVINVSSPNTPGLRALQSSTRLVKLIKYLRKIQNCPPLLIKIAPDLENHDIDEIAKIASQENLAGLIAVNTSINRLGLENRLIQQTGQLLKEEKGGLSGKPLRGRALEVIKRLYAQSDSNFPLIGVGGIDSPESAWERITAGASLLQVYTGWIYKGPLLISNINAGIANQLDHHGLKDISAALGSQLPWISE